MDQIEEFINNIRNRHDLQDPDLRIGILFENVPEEQRNAWLDYLNNEVLPEYEHLERFGESESTPERYLYRTNRRSRSRLCSLVWTNINGLLPFYIPLISLKFSSIFNLINLKKFLLNIYQFLISFFQFIKVTFTIFTFALNTAKVFFQLGNYVTNSSNYLADLITFILKDDKTIIRFKTLMYNHNFDDWLDCVDFIQNSNMNDPSYRNLGIFSKYLDYFYLNVYAFLATLIRTKCQNENCQIVESLPFYFGRAFEEHLQFKEKTIHILTVGFYLTYTLIGQSLCLWLSILFVKNYLLKALKYAQIFAFIFKVLWRKI